MPMIWRAAVAAFAGCLIVAAPAAAQDPTGAIEGVVTDGSAAVIGGAEVVITHIDTGAAREARSGADGFFRVPVLAAGRYRVAARAPRFATTVQEPIDVTVSQTARVNI